MSEYFLFTCPHNVILFNKNLKAIFTVGYAVNEVLLVNWMKTGIKRAVNLEAISRRHDSGVDNVRSLAKHHSTLNNCNASVAWNENFASANREKISKMTVFLRVMFYTRSQLLSAMPRISSGCKVPFDLMNFRIACNYVLWPRPFVLKDSKNMSVRLVRIIRPRLRFSSDSIPISNASRSNVYVKFALPPVKVLLYYILKYRWLGETSNKEEKL